MTFRILRKCQRPKIHTSEMDDSMAICFSDTSLCFGGLGEMAAGTSNDYALLTSPECTSDECLFVKWKCLKSSGADFLLFVIVCQFLSF